MAAINDVKKLNIVDWISSTRIPASPWRSEKKLLNLKNNFEKAKEFKEDNFIVKPFYSQLSLSNNKVQITIKDKDNR